MAAVELHMVLEELHVMVVNTYAIVLIKGCVWQGIDCY
jgi:hypothetical protein